MLRGFSDGFARVSGLPSVRAPRAKPSMLRKTIHCKNVLSFHAAAGNTLEYTVKMCLAFMLRKGIHCKNVLSFHTAQGNLL